MKKKNKLVWLLDVKKDKEDLYIEFPDSLLDQAGWKTGDKILWEETKNGYKLTKINDNI
jgi:hypothetical protein